MAEKKRISFSIDDELFQELINYCVVHNFEINDIIAESIKDKLKTADMDVIVPSEEEFDEFVDAFLKT